MISLLWVVASMSLVSIGITIYEIYKYKELVSEVNGLYLKVEEYNLRANEYKGNYKIESYFRDTDGLERFIIKEWNPNVGYQAYGSGYHNYIFNDFATLNDAKNYIYKQLQFKKEEVYID